MLIRDLSFYRCLLRRLPLGELAALYERTVHQYPALAQAVAEEMNTRLGG